MTNEDYNQKIKSIIFSYMNKSAPLTAIVIDDDPFSCLHLQELIQHKTSDLEVIAICNSAEEGMNQIQELCPDIVFLDIEMPGGMNGFDLLKKLPKVNFDVIFTTAHEHHAIRAIHFSAVDYLVKPINTIGLQESIDRVKEKKSIASIDKPEYIEVISDKKRMLDNLAIPTLEGLVFVGIDEIVYCEGSDKYTKVFLNSNKYVLSSKTLGEFEKLLESHGFYRIHKSHLINLNHIKKYIRGEGGQVGLSDGSILDVSRRRKEGLLKLVAHFK